MRNFKGIFALSAMVLLSVGTFAQGIDLNTPVPADKKYRVGTLENGMRYYIRQNVTEKERADFYIAQNVGAILEEDSQNGLAHFLEHMAFNGTKNFPDKKIIQYFETIGVKFGQNINAFTSLDETVYNLANVPTNRASIVDSALLVLHDWSGFISLKGEEIDAERGVIREEWRTGRSADRRMNKELLPVMYKNSQYAKRDVIGDINVINTFDHQVIKDYYHKWYRPDLQAIVIVGDIDVDKVENTIKAMFADIPKRDNSAPRTFYDVPDNDAPIIGIATDAEARNSMVRISYKRNTTPKDQKNIGYYRNTIINNLVSSMMRARLSELTQKPNPPFVYSYSNIGGMVRTKDAYMTIAIVNNEKILDGMNAMIRESERMKRFGFTASELGRAKADYLRNLENSLKEKDKEKNEKYVWACINNFLEGEPMSSEEFDYMFSSNILPSISIEELNAFAKTLVTDNNMVVAVTGPKKDDVKMPSEQDILASIAAVKAEAIEAYVDQVSNKPLVEKVPVAGSVKKTTEDKVFGTTELTLSNGVKVVFKKTDFKEDEIIMDAFSKGGLSLVSAADLPSGTMACDLVSAAGVGEFGSVELEKMLAGKVVQVRPSIGNTYEGFSGSASPKDFETMLQLVYLYATQPKIDEAAYTSFMDRMKAYFANVGADPRSAFRDSISATVYGHNPRMMPMNVEFLNKVDYAKAMKIYKDRFADASDMVFIFTGNVNIEESKKLIETYLGGLPSIKRVEAAKDNGVYPVKGKVTNYFTKKLNTPKTSAYITYTGKADYTLENIVAMDAIESILSNRYLETIREKEGGSYGVGVRGSVSDFPKPSFSILMSFDTDPAKKDKLIAIIHEEVKTLMTTGPAEETLAKAKEHFVKTYETNVRENGYWSNAIREKYENNLDQHTAYLTVVNGLTVAKIKEVANKMFGQKNFVEVVMSPAE